jgi:hypothetical protein
MPIVAALAGHVVLALVWGIVAGVNESGPVSIFEQGGALVWVVAILFPVSLAGAAFTTIRSQQRLDARPWLVFLSPVLFLFVGWILAALSSQGLTVAILASALAALVFSCSASLLGARAFSRALSHRLAKEGYIAVGIGLVTAMIVVLTAAMSFHHARAASAMLLAIPSVSAIAACALAAAALGGSADARDDHVASGADLMAAMGCAVVGVMLAGVAVKLYIARAAFASLAGDAVEQSKAAAVPALVAMVPILIALGVTLAPRVALLGSVVARVWPMLGVSAGQIAALVIITSFRLHSARAEALAHAPVPVPSSSSATTGAAPGPSATADIPPPPPEVAPVADAGAPPPSGPVAAVMKTVSASGTLKADQVDKVMHQKASQFAHCKATGDITLIGDVTPGGGVFKVTKSGTSTVREAQSKCLVKTFRGVRFARSKGRSKVTVSFGPE